MVDVHGEWVFESGPASGHYAVYLPVRLQDATGNVIYPAGRFASGSLVAGEFTVTVPASNDPALSPNGWQLQIDVTLDGAEKERYQIPVPSGSTIELADVVLPQTLGDPEPVLIRGVAGGIAELDSSGHVPTAQLPAGFGSWGAAYTFTALASWSISHSLGRLPVVSVFVGGHEVITDVDATTSSATVTFPAPTSGVAVLA